MGHPGQVRSSHEIDYEEIMNYDAYFDNIKAIACQDAHA